MVKIHSEVIGISKYRHACALSFNYVTSFHWPISRKEISRRFINYHGLLKVFDGVNQSEAVFSSPYYFVLMSYTIKLILSKIRCTLTLKRGLCCNLKVH